LEIEGYCTFPSRHGLLPKSRYSRNSLKTAKTGIFDSMRTAVWSLNEDFDDADAVKTEWIPLYSMRAFIEEPE